MSEKPEWFELSDEEPKPESGLTNKASKSSKKRFVKIALFTAPLLLIGGAMVFAEGGNENDDVPAGVGTLSPATSTASDNSSTNTTDTTNTGGGVANPSANNGTTSSKSLKSAKGVGVPKPSGGGDHEGREGGEHEGGGFGGDDD